MDSKLKEVAASVLPDLKKADNFISKGEVVFKIPSDTYFTLLGYFTFIEAKVKAEETE